MALSWEGTTWSDPFSSRIPFLFKQWWSGSGGRVGHKGSPLHTALVERHKFLVLGGLPQQTVFWNQNLTHRNQQVKGGWLLLVCHFLDALQTYIYIHMQAIIVVRLWTIQCACQSKWKNDSLQKSKKLKAAFFPSKVASPARSNYLEQMCL